MKTFKFDSIWGVIEDAPQEAASMQARSWQLKELAQLIDDRGFSQCIGFLA